jgi:hypothetical protein
VKSPIGYTSYSQSHSAIKQGEQNLAENLTHHIVKTCKEPDIITLNMGTHSVEIQDTFAEIFFSMEISPA